MDLFIWQALIFFMIKLHCPKYIEKYIVAV